MQVLTDLATLPAELNGAIVGLGNFDGVHIAHQEIIKTCVNSAHLEHKKSVIITFNPHPFTILRPNAEHKTIITHEEKIAMFAALGVDYVYVIPFNKTWATMEAKDFIHKILYEKLNALKVVTGYNFFFGKERKGNSQMLYEASKYYNFQYQVIDKIGYNHHDVSSSNIKRLMQHGAFGIVNAILARPYAIQGIVQHGYKRGKEINIPTINLYWQQNIHPPLFGVYLTKTIIDGKEYHSISNIGIRPTFNNVDGQILLETHIFDFAKDIYGQNAIVQFLHFLRPERNFKTIENLKTQILLDVKLCHYLIKLMPK